MTKQQESSIIKKIQSLIKQSRIKVQKGEHMEVNNIEMQNKMRIIQEIVPGKQITIAHVIANPDTILHKKLGLNPEIDYSKSAIGIITMSPSETAIIAGDIAIKTSGVEIGFVDRFSGTLIVTGTISEVQTSLSAVVDYAKEKLGFAVCDITRT